MGEQALPSFEQDRLGGPGDRERGAEFLCRANLIDLDAAVQQGRWEALERRVERFQRLVIGFRLSGKPVVAAGHGRTLGGQAQLALHADRIVAAAETSIDLVEVDVGLVPAGGGTKELARRLISQPLARSSDVPALPFAQKAFETIGQARVSGSAIEARTLGFLSETDVIVMNPDHLLMTARRVARELAAEYRPLAPDKRSMPRGKPPWRRYSLAFGSFSGAAMRQSTTALSPDTSPCAVWRGDLSTAVGRRSVHPQARTRSVSRSAAQSADPGAHPGHAHEWQAAQKLRKNKEQGIESLGSRVRFSVLHAEGSRR